jgi:hypothetical protein
MGFLDNYETVNQKVIRLHATYPTNRIETLIIDWNAEKGYILIECRIYRRYEDEKPAAIDYAHGMVGAYNPQMKRWYIEDTVSSAIGRCASVVLGTETKPSLENMQQVETMPKAFIEEDLWSKPFGEDGFATAQSAISEIQTKLGGELIPEAPICAHGHMILKEGVSPKTSKPYRGHVCTEKVKANQCSPIWYEVTPSGGWKAQANG